MSEEALLKKILKKLDDIDSRLKKIERSGYSIPHFPSVFSVPLNTVDQCTDGNPHEYPTIWNGIIPPPCNKCGKARASSGTVTITNGSSESIETT